MVETEGQCELRSHKSQILDRTEGSDGNGKWLYSLRPAVFHRQGFMVHYGEGMGVTLIYSRRPIWQGVNYNFCLNLLTLGPR